MRLVIDTNCFLVIVPKRSPFRWVYDKILIGEITLVVTTEILCEYAEQLEVFYSLEYANLILKVLINLPNVVKVNPISFNWRLIETDADDNKFVDAYIASNAIFIVTNDRHFRTLQNIKIPTVSCVKLEKFTWS